MHYKRIILIVAAVLLLALIGKGIYRFVQYDLACTRGTEYLSHHQYQQAVAAYTTALRYTPHDVEIRCNRASAYDYLKDFPHAVQDYDAAIRDIAQYDRDNHDLAGEIYFNRGLLYGHNRHYPEAIADYRKAIALKPAIEDAHGCLARLLAIRPGATASDGNEAVPLATKACEQTKWQDAEVLAILAAACARAGDFTKAVTWQQKALSLNKDANNAKEYQARIKLYQNNTPYTDTSTQPSSLEGPKMMGAK